MFSYAVAAKSIPTHYIFLCTKHIFISFSFSLWFFNVCLSVCMSVCPADSHHSQTTNQLTTSMKSKYWPINNIEKYIETRNWVNSTQTSRLRVTTTKIFILCNLSFFVYFPFVLFFVSVSQSCETNDGVQIHQTRKELLLVHNRNERNGSNQRLLVLLFHFC